jgi:hypothetical protein
MHRWGKQKPVHFDEKELKTDLGSGNFIFVGSSCDMFAESIPEKWIVDTLTYCTIFPDNQYLFQSKNPAGIINYELFLPRNFVVCTTLETDSFYPGIMGDSPHPVGRSLKMWLISNAGYKTYITIEPIMDFHLDHFVRMIRRCHPEQVNIGADSGNNHLPEPSKEKLLALIAELQKFTVIAKKRNLDRILRSTL